MVNAVDRFQRRHPVIGFPLAVVYKFFDDQGNYLAAIVTYYAFIAIFPLLLIASSVLGFFVQGNDDLRDRLLDSALGQFPIIGEQLQSPAGVTGSTSAIIVGVIAALYGSLGLGQASQNVMYVAWSVPRNSRPNPLALRLRSFLLLVTAGIAVVLVTLLTTLVSNVEVVGLEFAQELHWLLTLATIVITTLAFGLLYYFGRVTRGSWRSALPGALAVAVMWQGLQYAGTAYVDRVINRAESVNGTFALVLGLMGLIYIAAMMATLGVEINVVISKRLFPRALLTPFTDNVELTAADQRAYRDYAKAQRHKGFQTVQVLFEKDKPETPPPDETSDKARKE
ncbi:hypothetical protein BH09ACT10_BH09ACT10_19770 [soil metagenome]